MTSGETALMSYEVTIRESDGPKKDAIKWVDVETSPTQYKAVQITDDNIDEARALYVASRIKGYSKTATLKDWNEVEAGKWLLKRYDQLRKDDDYRIENDSWFTVCYRLTDPTHQSTLQQTWRANAAHLERALEALEDAVSRSRFSTTYRRRIRGAMERVRGVVKNMRGGVA